MPTGWRQCGDKAVDTKHYVSIGCRAPAAREPLSGTSNLESASIRVSTRPTCKDVFNRPDASGEAGKGVARDDAFAPDSPANRICSTYCKGFSSAPFDALYFTDASNDGACCIASRFTTSFAVHFALTILPVRLHFIEYHLV